MQWTTRESNVLHEGDTRVRLIFAVWPKRCTDGTLRWFECIEVHETFEYASIGPPTDPMTGYFWIPKKYVALKARK